MEEKVKIPLVLIKKFLTNNGWENVKNIDNKLLIWKKENKTVQIPAGENFADYNRRVSEFLEDIAKFESTIKKNIVARIFEKAGCEYPNSIKYPILGKWLIEDNVLKVSDKNIKKMFFDDSVKVIYQNGNASTFFNVSSKIRQALLKFGYEIRTGSLNEKGWWISEVRKERIIGVHGDVVLKHTIESKEEIDGFFQAAEWIIKNIKNESAGERQYITTQQLN